MSKAKHIEKSIEWAKKKGFTDFKTDLVEGFESPKSFTRSSDNVEFSADMTAQHNTKKHYFHVVLKAEESSDVESQIQLIHALAKAKGTKLYLMAPTGNLKYARDMAAKFEQSEVIRI